MSTTEKGLTRSPLSSFATRLCGAGKKAGKAAAAKRATGTNQICAGDQDQKQKQQKTRSSERLSPKVGGWYRRVVEKSAESVASDNCSTTTSSDKTTMTNANSAGGGAGNNHNNNSAQNRLTASSKKRNSSFASASSKQEAEKVEKLRKLVDYLRSEHLISPVDLDADELELAQRYKMHLIICEDCNLQSPDSMQHNQSSASLTDFNLNNNMIRRNQISMIDMDHYPHHQTLNGNGAQCGVGGSSLVNGLEAKSLDSKNDNFDTNSSTNSQNNFCCCRQPLDGSSVSGKDQAEQVAEGAASVFSEIGTDSGININVIDNSADGLRDRVDVDSGGSNPHIGTVSWVLRHSISDPGNNCQYNNSLSSAVNTPPRQQSPSMLNEALSTSGLDEVGTTGEFPMCANCNQDQKQQQQTSAWTNPQNLATWIDNEVNSLINDLEAKSQFISKEKPAKGSVRRWLSSSNRRGSSGAHSN